MKLFKYVYVIFLLALISVKAFGENIISKDGNYTVKSQNSNHGSLFYEKKNDEAWTQKTFSASHEYLARERTTGIYRYQLKECIQVEAWNGKDRLWELRTVCSGAITNHSDTYYVILTPSTLTANKSGNNINLSWSSVPGATGYKLQQQSSVNGAWIDVTVTTETSHEITGGGSGEYRFRVSAKVANFNGDYAYSSPVDILYAPAQINTPTVENYDGTYTVSWSSVSTATSYTVEEKQGDTGAWKQVYSGANTRKQVSKSVNGDFFYRVKACRNTTCSIWKNSTKVNVFLPPDQVSTITVPSDTVINGIFDLSWSVSNTATYYQVEEQINGGSWGNSLNISNTEYSYFIEFDGQYYYRIRACNRAGCSSWKTSRLVTVRYPNALDGKVKLIPIAGEITIFIPVVTSVSINSFSFDNGEGQVSWSAHSDAYYYIVKLTDEDGNVYTYTTFDTQFTLSEVGVGEFTVTVSACNASNVCSPDSVAGYIVTNEIVRYQHTDNLGSVVAETNSSGTELSRITYEPYGNKIGAARGGIGYTGHIHDKDIGLTYMQARYYDPVIGRFYSNDPVGAIEHLGGAGGIHGFNRYAYANNNPYKYVDPDGRKVEVVARPLKTPILGGAGVHTYTKVTQSDGTETIFSSHKVDGKNQVSKNHSSDQAKHKFIGKTTISPPEGMTQEQFDQAVLEQGQSMIESDSLDYSAFPSDPGEGNCNTTTRNLINGAGGKIPESFDPKGMNPDLHGDRKTNEDQ